MSLKPWEFLLHPPKTEQTLMCVRWGASEVITQTTKVKTCDVDAINLIFNFRYIYDYVF